jgi:hypothetical protein
MSGDDRGIIGHIYADPAYCLGSATIACAAVLPVALVEYARGTCGPCRRLTDVMDGVQGGNHFLARPGENGSTYQTVVQGELGGPGEAPRDAPAVRPAVGFSRSQVKAI